MKREPKEPQMVRVITMKGDGFTDATGEWHPWGHEFAMREGSELTELLLAGVVRIDDRGAAPPPAQPVDPEVARAERLLEETRGDVASG